MEAMKVKHEAEVAAVKADLVVAQAGAKRVSELSAELEAERAALRACQSELAMVKEAPGGVAGLTAAEVEEVGKAVSEARAKFNALDSDGSGVLDGAELEALATWSWESFHPGQEITAGARAETGIRSDALVARLGS